MRVCLTSQCLKRQVEAGFGKLPAKHNQSSLSVPGRLEARRVMHDEVVLFHAIDWTAYGPGSASTALTRGDCSQSQSRGFPLLIAGHLQASISLVCVLEPTCLLHFKNIRTDPSSGKGGVARHPLPQIMQEVQQQRRKTLAMHQFARPRHNKLHSNSLSSSTSSTASAATLGGDPFGSFFSKFSVRGSSSAAKDDLEVTQSGASMYSPLEWSCRGPESPESEAVSIASSGS